MSNFLQLQTWGTFDTLNGDYVRNSIIFLITKNNRCCSRINIPIYKFDCYVYIESLYFWKYLIEKFFFFFFFEWLEIVT